MEARLLRAIVLVGLLHSLGAASYRTTNFLCTAPTPELAREVCEQAEVFRRDLAIQWLGHELPSWQQPCPITAQVDPRKGAGGETSFMFAGNGPYNWQMRIQGSRELILNSVLPHEVTHTIFATHFRQPLPRWCDEGACTTVEVDSERAKQDRMLIQFLTTSPSRGIAFNRMFAMREYPADIMPLYSQGYSVTMFLIAQGGHQHFIDYVGEGLNTDNWTAATAKFYQYNSLSDLQVTWLEWVRRGSPELNDALLAELRDGGQPQGEIQLASNQSQPSASAVASTGESWYLSHRDAPQDDRGSRANDRTLAVASQSAAAQASLASAEESTPLNWVAPGTADATESGLVPLNQATRPQPPEHLQPRVIEPASRSVPADAASARSAEVWQPGSVRYDAPLDERVIRR